MFSVKSFLTCIHSNWINYSYLPRTNKEKKLVLMESSAVINSV